MYDCRREVCALGESCTAPVIALFDSRLGGGGMAAGRAAGAGQPASEANAAVVEFLNLQLACHNPSGAVTRGEGAFWGVGEEAWHACLLRVYGNLVDANIANGVRSLRVKVALFINELIKDTID